jgi:hypothetical protein
VSAAQEPLDWRRNRAVRRAALGETYSIDPASGTDQVRTGCLQEGFGILEWEMFVLGNETLEFLAFSKS